jgi:hypothetical protein
MNNSFFFFLLIGGFGFVMSSLVIDSQSSYSQQPSSSVQFSSATTAKQVVDAYKARVPFKNYIANAVKSAGTPDEMIIKNQLSSGNIACGGSDAITKTNTCDGVISFAKLACEDNPSISPNCSHGYINQYITQRHLDLQALNKGAYKQLAHIMVDAHPEAQGNDAVFELR